MLHHARMSYVCGLGVRPSIRFIVAGSGSKCFTGAAGPDDIIAVPDFFCDWLQMRNVMICVIVETHISYDAPALRLPGSIIYSKIHCIGKCPFYMVFSNVLCVSEDVNSSVVDHGARGHF